MRGLRGCQRACSGLAAAARGGKDWGERWDGRSGSAQTVAQQQPDSLPRVAVLPLLGATFAGLPASRAGVLCASPTASVDISTKHVSSNAAVAAVSEDGTWFMTPVFDAVQLPLKPSTTQQGSLGISQSSSPPWLCGAHFCPLLPTNSKPAGDMQWMQSPRPTSSGAFTERHATEARLLMMCLA